MSELHEIKEQVKLTSKKIDEIWDEIVGKPEFHRKGHAQRLNELEEIGESLVESNSLLLKTHENHETRIVDLEKTKKTTKLVEILKAVGLGGGSAVAGATSPKWVGAIGDFFKHLF